jgi:exodeoxyribonuclease VII small subunit
MTTEKKPLAKDLTFEEAITRLEVLVRELEEGRQPLAESLELFAEGIELAGVCELRLADAEQRLIVLKE